MKPDKNLNRPPKNEDIANVVREAFRAGRYRFSAHALERMRQRSITRIDIRDVLLEGRREKRKDFFDVPYLCWKYAWRGQDEDGRALRIIVKEQAPGILIITAIELDREDHD